MGGTSSRKGSAGHCAGSAAGTPGSMRHRSPCPASLRPPPNRGRAGSAKTRCASSRTQRSRRSSHEVKTPGPPVEELHPGAVSCAPGRQPCAPFDESPDPHVDGLPPGGDSLDPGADSCAPTGASRATFGDSLDPGGEGSPPGDVSLDPADDFCAPIAVLCALFGLGKETFQPARVPFLETVAVSGGRLGRKTPTRPSAVRAPVSALVQRGANPLQANALRPGTKDNCVAARRGGEQSEVRDRSAD